MEKSFGTFLFFRVSEPEHKASLRFYPHAEIVLEVGGF